MAALISKPLLRGYIPSTPALGQAGADASPAQHCRSAATGGLVAAAAPQGRALPSALSPPPRRLNSRAQRRASPATCTNVAHVARVMSVLIFPSVPSAVMVCVRQCTPSPIIMCFCGNILPLHSRTPRRKAIEYPSVYDMLLHAGLWLCRTLPPPAAPARGDGDDDDHASGRGLRAASTSSRSIAEAVIKQTHIPSRRPSCAHRALTDRCVPA